MKRYGVLALLFLFMSLAAAYMAGAVSSVVGSKHDLSRPALYGGTGPGPIQSSNAGTTQVCVFCHTPHGSTKDAPLWNRSINTWDTYEPYYSDVMGAFSPVYPAPEDLKTGAVHVKTRICLSCHDGTIALGNMANLPYPSGSDVPMQGGVNKIPKPAQGYIGLELQDDHPVAIKHDSTKDPELASSIGGGKIWLYDASVTKTSSGAGTGYVECTTCHNAHDNTNKNFLVDSNLGSNICTTCHTKEVGAAATRAHDNATGVVYDPDGTSSIGTNVGQVKCMNCHFPHKAGITDTTQLPRAQPANFSANAKAGYYLLAFQEEMSCFNNDSLNNHKNRWAQVSNVCHGTGATNGGGKTLDIQTDVNRTSAHRVGDQAGKHEAVEVKSTTLNGWFDSNKWHVECADCHNPHTAGTGLHTKGTNTIDTTSSLSSLYGVSYVRPSGYPSGSWSAPVSFTPFEPLGATTSSSWATDVKEYEICFKCHSYFATQGTPFPNAATISQAMSDQSKEFNATTSFHPVAVGNTNSWGDMLNGWNSNGTQVMYCSDCHTKENYSRPQGAHGTSVSSGYILPYTYYDDKAALGNPDDSASTFCLQCHNPNTYVSGAGTNTGFYTNPGGMNLHTQHYANRTNVLPSGLRFAYRCVNCHIRTPHGWNERGMIHKQGDNASHLNGNWYEPVSGPTITGLSLPASPRQYDANKNVNCQTINGCHQ